jgi:hypothetical protein
MTNVDARFLELVCGGEGSDAPAKAAEPAAKKATYGDACLRGGVSGALTGATGGAGMLPFAMLSGPLTPATVGAFMGIGAGSGAVIGCAEGMFDLYKARRPLEP